jgi:hypothetical protein
LQDTINSPPYKTFLDLKKKHTKIQKNCTYKSLLISGTRDKPFLVQEFRQHASARDNLATKYVRVSNCEAAFAERMDTGAGQNNFCISCVVKISLFFDRSIDGLSSINSASSSTCH